MEWSSSSQVWSVSKIVPKEGAVLKLTWREERGWAHKWLAGWDRSWRRGMYGLWGRRPVAKLRNWFWVCQCSNRCADETGDSDERTKRGAPGVRIFLSMAIQWALEPLNNLMRNCRRELDGQSGLNVREISGLPEIDCKRLRWVSRNFVWQRIDKKDLENNWSSQWW